MRLVTTASAAIDGSAAGEGAASGTDPQAASAGPVTPAVSTAPDEPVVPAAPAVAREVFGPAFPLAERYAELLAGPGIVRGLLGPREGERLWERHLLNSALLAELVPRPSTLVDIGSGAGLPGLVLAMLLPDVQVTLVEPMARRVVFLGECVAALGLDNVRIRRARAEEVAGEFSADVVTARAVAPLDRLAGLAVPLVRPGGLVLAVKGERAAAEAAAAGPVLRKLGVSDVAVVRAGTGWDCPATTVVTMRVAVRAAKSRRPRPGPKRSRGGTAKTRR
jgi:16S rRNA (guanine527-N7)-methyltransferase